MNPVAFAIPVAEWLHNPMVRWVGLGIALVLIAIAVLGAAALKKRGLDHTQAWERMMWFVMTGVLVGIVTFFMPIWPKVIEIRWYGVMMASSMLAGAWISSRLLKRIGRNGDLIWDGLFWIILAGVAGARLVYVLTNLSMYFGPDIPAWHLFAVWEGGLSFHGGIIAGLIATYYYFRDKNIGFLEIMDSFAPGVSIGIVLVRIGNFMNGDITGYKWNGPWAMNFPHDTLHMGNPGAIILRHPAELYGLFVGVLCALIAIVIWIETYETRRFPQGTNFMGFILSYSIIRSIFEEPFRDVPLPWKVVDPTTAGYGLFTSTQITSVFLVLLGLWGLSQLRHWEKLRAAAGKLGLAGAPAGATRQVRRAAKREQEKHTK